mmetsp:Transcript_10796/g.13661  ORF Transcript_10796/g.13661 Transcript_10796/m.13661 type:complete len:462 (+) Transcript_10796:100-1485(+)
MNAELLAMLGGAGAVPSRREAEPKTLISFKAGKMNAERQEDGRYMVTADPRRGTIEVNWTQSSSSSASSGELKIEWRDRRTRAIVDSLTIFPEDDCTYSKVDTGNDKDRVYLLQYGNVSERRFFFWMQDKEEGNLDEENCVKINMYMADSAEAAAAANGEESPSAASASGSKSKKASGKEGDTAAGSGSGSGSNNDSSRMDISGLGGGGLDNAALMQIMQGLNDTGAGDGNGNDNASGNTSSAQGGQVDTLSNILENLGMPQQSSNTGTSTNTNENANTTSTSTAPAVTSSDTPAATGGLTLSDLQGAMAGLATTSPTSQIPAGIPAAHAQSGPPLSEIATPDAISSSGILENDEIKTKLIALLPEGQRSEEKLMENLRSPQVKQCLKSLSAALEEEEGSSFNSILANFQLRPEDGAMALAAGNPIQAFLDCVLRDVEREKEQKENSKEKKDEDGDSEMKE